MNHEELVSQFYDRFNRRDLDGAMDVFADDAEFRLFALDVVLKGKAQILEGFRSWVGAFPDLKLSPTLVSETRAGAVAEVMCSGTQKGQFQSPIGLLPPSGHGVRWDGCDVFNIRNGKIRSVHTYNDAQTIIQQIIRPGSIRAA